MDRGRMFVGRECRCACMDGWMDGLMEVEAGR